MHGIDVASGVTDLAPALAAIAELEADVVAVQEVDRSLARSDEIDQVQAIAKHLGWQGVFGPALLGSPDASWRAADRDETGGPAYGVGIISRYPIRGWSQRRLPGGGDGQRTKQASPQRPGWDYEPRTALAADLDVEGSRLRVTTTHLSYLPWRAIAQLQVAAGLARAEGGPAVLLGDLNLPRWPVRASLPTWQHAAHGATYPSWGPRATLDQLLVHGGVRVLEAAAGPRGPSDHLPLVATIAL
ncbi:MAG: endonuclease/exonuclease/phosphatase family protein [Actinomycetota bacterium]|nr:endonuclease/exonuclease/phosphatase family protein [Euzebyaceae bacterium]MDQ3452596.1 endonuclease/exonuclease/phosphatase family protein [Actinomycetota bacterium]